MINVAALISDPDFAQTFTVNRLSGTWVQGRFVTTTQSLRFVGSVQPQNTKDIVQLPNGDTVRGGIDIYTTQRIYITQLGPTDKEGNLSDEIVWLGDTYKAMQVLDYSNFGYYKTTAVRKVGT